MNITFLKFYDEQAALFAMGMYTDNDGNFIFNDPNYSIDIIGIIYDGGTYQYNDDGTTTVVDEPTPRDGWHVNFLGDLDSSLMDYIITPKNPVRIFA